MSFFWRIFLSAWAIMLVTAAATFWAGSWLPGIEDEANQPPVPEQMVDLIADEFRLLLAADPTTAASMLVARRALDYSPIFIIYVIDPAGNDILERELPMAVADVVGQLADPNADVAELERSKLHVSARDLGGYLVVGEEGYFPLGQVLMRKGGRGLLLVFMVLVSAAFSYLLARFIVLPVRRLQLAGQRVADGDLTARVAPSVGNRTDEIARLAHDFDVMTERVDGLLKSQQRMMRDVSHELRSPLARLQALLSIARQAADSPGSDRIDRMEKELERLDELIGEILTFARLETRTGIARQPTDVVDLVQNIVDDASLEAQAMGKQIQMSGPEQFVIELDSSLIQSAVENVIRNALKYTAEDTAVEINIVDQTSGVRIVIDDHGPGIPEEAIDQIFDPFFRVGEARGTQSGTGGIGLAIAERSVRLHGGTITARNRDGAGLRVEIDIPESAAV
jgi:two-component system sensor histidine kinase CpxA